MVQAALKALKAITERSNKHVIYNPPEMVPQWQDSFEKELMTATKAALDAGAEPEKVLRMLQGIASVDLDRLPDKYMAACVDAGLSPDTGVDGETLLHMLLNHPYPPPIKPPPDVAAAAAAALKQLPRGRNPACGCVTLNELLKRKATPNKEDAAGNTAMHMLVACMVQRVQFPDPRLPSADTQDDEAETAAALAASGVEAPPSAAPGEDVPKRLEDNDAVRAAYAEVAFQMLLDAGWEPGWRNHNGYTVSNLIEAGLARYQAELYDLQDPEGVAQTTVSLLSERAPDKQLKEFLDHKIAGIEAVVGCLQIMHGLAASADQPRKTRSALSLMLLWLLLLVGTVYWMFSRRQA